ncbi:MAG: hypothetical protein ACI9XO_003835 [Paraglaciecola sp.]|jgi:hypothetical protein
MVISLLIALAMQFFNAPIVQTSEVCFLNKNLLISENNDTIIHPF